MSKMMRVNEELLNRLDAIAKSIKKSKQETLAAALELFSQELFIKKANLEYAQLFKDPQAKKELTEEFALWDTTVMDGLDE